MTISSPTESRAAEIMQDILQGVIIWRDISGAPPNTHDFEVQCDNEITVAVEVTRIADQDGRSFWATVNKTDWSAPSLQQSWLLTLRQSARVKDVRAQLEPLLSVLESNHITGFGPLQPEAREADATFQELKRLGVKAAKAFEMSPAVIMVSTVGAGVTGPDIVSSALGQEAWKPDNRSKLTRAKSTERHLFVWVEADAHQIHVAIDAMRDLAIMPGPIDLPDEVDVVWVGTPRNMNDREIVSEELWKFNRADGWIRVR